MVRRLSRRRPTAACRARHPWLERRRESDAARRIARPRCGRPCAVPRRPLSRTKRRGRVRLDAALRGRHRRRPSVAPRRCTGRAACVVLLGHSVGAGASLLAASRDPSVAAVVSIAAMAHPGTLMRANMRARGIPGPLITVILRRSSAPSACRSTRSPRSRRSRVSALPCFSSTAHATTWFHPPTRRGLSRRPPVAPGSSWSRGGPRLPRCVPPRSSGRDVLHPGRGARPSRGRLAWRVSRRLIPWGVCADRRHARSAADRAGRAAAPTWNRSSATCRPPSGAGAAPTTRPSGTELAASAATGEEPEPVTSAATTSR